MTLQELRQAEDVGYKENTIYKTARELEQQSFLAKGIKDSRAVTYYITKPGINFLERIKKEQGET